MELEVPSSVIKKPSLISQIKEGALLEAEK